MSMVIFSFIMPETYPQCTPHLKHMLRHHSCCPPSRILGIVQEMARWPSPLCLSCYPKCHSFFMEMWSMCVLACFRWESWRDPFFGQHRATWSRSKYRNGNNLHFGLSDHNPITSIIDISWLHHSIEPFSLSTISSHSYWYYHKPCTESGLHLTQIRVDSVFGNSYQKLIPGIWRPCFWASTVSIIDSFTGLLIWSSSLTNYQW